MNEVKVCAGAAQPFAAGSTALTGRALSSNVRLLNKMIKTLINRTIKNYINLLEKYYPAHASTGFMETNQVFQFCKSIYSEIPNSFCWLEPPLKRNGKSSEHIDAVAFLPDQETAIFIEAKRIDKLAKKKSEIIEDTFRILNLENRKHITKNANFKPKKHIILILADVWLESSGKKEIPYWWTSNENPTGMRNTKSNPKNKTNTFINQMALGGIAWKEENQYIHRFDAKDLKDDCLENYCLLFGYHEVDVT